MAKESPADEDRRKEKRIKKEKKEKRSEKDGVRKSKKDKEKKKAPASDLLEPLSVTLDTEMTGVVSVKEDDGVETVVKPLVPIGALVPFANPLADEKVGRKLLKGVKKAAKHKCLKRGVKEVVKSLRKSASATAAGLEPGIVILAADISPMDVISHIPVLCEDHAAPYIYVTSRAELGAASSTKRPTSVVLITAGPGKSSQKKEKDEKKEEDEEDFGVIYKDLMKLVRKAGQDVKV